MPELSISTWSLHRALGKAWYDRTPDGFVNRNGDEGRIQLLDVPREVASQGIRHLEICHFHFPTTDDTFIADLRAELDRHDVSLYSILIDAWDITHPDPEQREKDLAEIRRWIDVASTCGAENVRVIAGEAEPDRGIHSTQRAKSSAIVGLCARLWHTCHDREFQAIDPACRSPTGYFEQM